MAEQKYVAVICGHGRSIDGSWDPGTTYAGNTESNLMLPITKACVKYLRNSGVKVYSDADKNNNLNMIKTIQKANSLGVDAYISIHCDYYKAGTGTLPLYHPNSAKGKKLAAAMNKCVKKDMKMVTRGLSKRTDLGELNDTNMPACIFETGSIKADITKLKQADKYGKALAKGICKYFGIKFKDSNFKIRTKGNLIVRKTSSLLSAKVETLEKGKIYYITETKGNRGKVKNKGWITITDKFVERL